MALLFPVSAFALFQICIWTVDVIREEMYYILVLDWDKTHTLACPRKKEDFLVIILHCAQDIMKHHVYVAVYWLVWTFIVEKKLVIQ